MNQRLVDPSMVQAVIIGRGALRNPWIFTGAQFAPVSMALLLYVVMQDLFIERPADFIRWIADEPLDLLKTPEDFWRLTLRFLNRSGQHCRLPEDVQSSPRALSRGKMIWNYLRSSLPSPFLDPRIMRVTKLSDLIMGIGEISRQSGLDPANLPLCYQSEHDWIFSGQGRMPANNQC
jgi:tRNA-dihydrouridine synthase